MLTLLKRKIRPILGQKLSSARTVVKGIVWFFLIACVFLASCDTQSEGSRRSAVTEMGELAEARIGVMAGTTAESYISERFPKAQLKVFDDIMDAIAALKSTQIDGVMTSYTTSLNVVNKNPDLRMLSERLQEEPARIAVSRNNPELLVKINAVLASLKREGTLEDIRRRWIKEDLSPYQPVEITLPQDAEVLHVAIAANREPLGFIDANRQISGFDPEVARRVAAGLGMQIEFLDMKFAALIVALESGKADVIISNMTATEERKKLVSFSDSYFVNPQMMLVRKAPSDESTLLAVHEDIKNKTVGVVLGSMHDTYMTKTYPQAVLLHYKSPPDVILALQTGKIDAAMYGYEDALGILRRDDTLGMLGGNVFSVDVGMGFHPENIALQTQFNEFLKQMKGNGVYGDMVKRWITEGKTEMPVIENSQTNGSLSVGIVSNKGLPFTFVENGQLIGFDIEMITRFAGFLGKKLNPVDMEFASLILSVATKKVDMIASSLYMTEERKKQVLFSDPYYSMGTSILALKENLAEYHTTVQEKVTRNFFDSIANSFYSNIILENRYLLILNGLRVTLIIAILACLFGTILGSLVCFLRMSKQLLFREIAKVYISVLRGTPVLVLLMIIFYVVFASVNIDPILVAVMAFGMNFAAYVSEIFRASIESIDKGQTEAGLAGGFSKVQTFIYIILPQATRQALPVYKGEFISLVKMTSIVGYIAVQDLTKASDIIRSRTFDAFFPLLMVGVLYFLITWLLTLVLRFIEVQVDPRARKKRSMSGLEK